MLRNIPNKIDQVVFAISLDRTRTYTAQALLKDIVNESSFGKYDFMYLRIGMSSCSSFDSCG